MVRGPIWINGIITVIPLSFYPLSKLRLSEFQNKNFRTKYLLFFYHRKLTIRSRPGKQENSLSAAGMLSGQQSVGSSGPEKIFASIGGYFDFPTVLPAVQF